jgi:citrate lyase subunit beta/citryl-CoA lyase
MRSHLFVPANRANMVEKAHQIPADVIVLDLEDSVPPAEKEAARAGLRDAIASLSAAGKTVHVRVNHLSTGLTRDDLDAAIGPGLSGLVFPKVDAAADIRELDVLIRQQEVHHQVRAGTNVLIPHIESARGLLRCEDIALASTRIGGLSVGAEDFVTDLGVARTPGGVELEYARRVIVHVCAAYGLQPLDIVYSHFQDEAGLLADARFGRSIGFKGKYVIHPAQVEATNAVFAPSAEEVEAARRVVAAFEAALAQGHASTQIDGRMVDTPVARRARDVIAFSEALGQPD